MCSKELIIKKIKQELFSSPLSLSALLKFVSLSKSSFRAWEKGYAIPNDSSLEKLVKAHKVLVYLNQNRGVDQ